MQQTHDFDFDHNNNNSSDKSCAEYYLGSDHEDDDDNSWLSVTSNNQSYPTQQWHGEFRRLPGIDYSPCSSPRSSYGCVRDFSPEARICHRARPSGPKPQQYSVSADIHCENNIKSATLPDKWSNPCHRQYLFDPDIEMRSASLGRSRRDPSLRCHHDILTPSPSFTSSSSCDSSSSSHGYVHISGSKRPTSHQQHIKNIYSRPITERKVERIRLGSADIDPVDDRIVISKKTGTNTDTGSHHDTTDSYHEPEETDPSALRDAQPKHHRSSRIASLKKMMGKFRRSTPNVLSPNNSTPEDNPTSNIPSNVQRTKNDIHHTTIVHDRSGNSCALKNNEIDRNNSIDTTPTPIPAMPMDTHIVHSSNNYIDGKCVPKSINDPTRNDIMDSSIDKKNNIHFVNDNHPHPTNDSAGHIDVCRRGSIDVPTIPMVTIRYVPPMPQSNSQSHSVVLPVDKSIPSCSDDLRSVSANNGSIHMPTKPLSRIKMISMLRKRGINYSNAKTDQDLIDLLNN